MSTVRRPSYRVDSRGILVVDSRGILVAAQQHAVINYGCGCSSCIGEWSRTHALGLNGWVRLLAPMPRRRPWHREDT